MVAMAAIFEKARQQFVACAIGVVALEQGLRKLQCDGRAAERFLGIAAVVLVGVEDGERIGMASSDRDR